MTLGDVAYSRFKDELLAGRLRPGAVVSQAELTARLAVAVTPLRDALRVLQAEGLVEVMPRSGIRIVKPDMGLVRHTYQLRRMIEREAVARYAETCEVPDIARWRAAHDAVAALARAVPEPPDLRARCRTVDDGFHEAVVAALRNPLIADVYRQTKARVLVIRLDQGYQLTPVMIRDTMAEHGAVLAALARHDRDGAVAAMDEHLTRALHRAMGV